MNNVMTMVLDFVTNLTKIAVSLIPLGVLVGLLFGDIGSIANVVNNLVALVESLGGAGLVGLLVTIILIHLLTDSK